MLVTAATNAEEAYTLLNEIVGIGDFTSADLTDFLSLISKQVGKKERSIENLTNDLKYGRLRSLRKEKTVTLFSRFITLTFHPCQSELFQPCCPHWFLFLPCRFQPVRCFCFLPIRSFPSLSSDKMGQSFEGNEIF